MALAWSLRRWLEARARFGRVERGGLDLVPPQALDERLGGGEQRFHRRRGRRRGRDRRGPGRREARRSARCARGRGGAKRGWRRGSPPSARAESPSKQKIGAGSSRHMRSSWASVTAVPSGATTSPIPAWSSAIDVHIAFDHDQAARRCGWRDRRGRGCRGVRPLSNNGVSGELRYLGSPVAEDAAAEGDDPAARVA